MDAYYLRGVAHEKLEDLPAAIADFTATLLLEPTHVKAILARGACYNLGSEYEAACGAPLPTCPEFYGQNPSSCGIYIAGMLWCRSSLFHRSGQPATLFTRISKCFPPQGGCTRRTVRKNIAWQAPNLRH